MFLTCLPSRKLTVLQTMTLPIFLSHYGSDCLSQQAMPLSAGCHRGSRTNFLVCLFSAGRSAAGACRRRRHQGRGGRRTLGEPRVTFAATWHRLSVVCLCEADSH